MTDLAGRTAFVTGGANGIGLGLARALLAEGCKVAIADIREESIEQAVKMLDTGEVIGVPLDVSSRDGFARAADQAEAALGPVSLLFNNAGINLFQTIDESSYDDWDWVLGVNLHGVINGVVTFVPRMKERGEGGHVVNTASMAGFLAGPVPGIYNCSKFAVRGLSESLCYSLVPHGIGVSVLCPGLVKSYIYASDEVRPEALKDARPGRPILPSSSGSPRSTRRGWSPTRSPPRCSMRSAPTASTSSRTPSTRTSCGRCSTRSSPTTPTATLPPTAWRSRRIGASATGRRGQAARDLGVAVTGTGRRPRGRGAAGRGSRGASGRP